MLYRAKGLIATALTVIAPATAFAGWPFSSDGPRRGSEEYYYARACDPIGERQKCKHARLWPPFNRPQGEEQTFVHKYHALHYWPYPYNIRDREDVRTVMRTQVVNGWATATTMYEYHFDPITHQLNGAGRQHLEWILTQAPPAYRQVNVQASQNPSFSEARMLSVQTAIASMAGGQNSIPVAMRTTDPLGRPATEVERIFQSSFDGALPPTIEYQTISTK